MSAATPVVRQSVLPEVRARLAELMAKAPVEEDEEGAARITMAILNAGSLDDVAAVFDGMDNTAKVAGLPLMFRSFVIRKSTYDAGIGVYAMVTATNRQSNEEVLFNTSAQAIISLLLLANERDWFPFTGHITAKTTAKGYDAYNLIPDE